MSVSSQIEPKICSFNVLEDCEPVINVVVNCLRYVNSKTYSEKTIDSIVSGWTIEKLKQISQEPERKIWVAKVDDQIVGVAGLVKNDIRMVFVNEKMHKQGIGKALIQNIEKIAKEAGIVELTVPAAIGSEGFYQKLGFNIVEEKEHDRGFNIIKMSKRI